MRLTVVLICCLCAILPWVGGCGKPKPPQPEGIQVVSGILPVTWLARRVGGDRIKVTTMVTTGQSPHTYEPKATQVDAAGKAKIFLATGLPFEQQLLAKVKQINTGLTVVDLRQGIKLRYMIDDEEAAEAHEHEEGEHHEEGHHHEKGEPDPHFWLSPRNAAIMAGTIAEALAAADPAHEQEYLNNSDALASELEQLDMDLAELLAPLKGKRIFVYHPAFGYFTDAYGMIQTPVEIGGKDPSPAQLARFIALAKEADAKIIFIQPQTGQGTAETIARQIKGAVVRMDPLSFDYAQNLRDMANRVRLSLGVPAEGER